MSLLLYIADLIKAKFFFSHVRSTSHVTTSWDKRKNLAFIVIHLSE